MSKLSIFETSWIDLVFEGRNKDYGAYQLRQESPKTTLISLFLALFFVLILVSLPTIYGHFYKDIEKPIVDNSPILGPAVYFPKSPVPEKKSVLPLSKKNLKSKPSLAKPIITEKPINKVEVPKIEDFSNNSTSDNTNTNGSESENIISKPDFGNVEISAKTSTTILNPYELDKNPEFPGGIKQFLNYVGRNFKTPEIELEKTVQIYVSFVVEKDGSMSNIMVKRDPGFGLGEEAIRVLKSLKTKWEPGKKDGNFVRAYYNLPITVELK